MEIWKGSQGPVLTNTEPFYDAETQTYFARNTYRGSAAAIAGLELDLQQQGLSYDISNDGPVFQLTTNLPLIQPDTQAVDQYEVFSEADQIDLFSDSVVFNEAHAWDLGSRVALNERTYKVSAEEYVESGTLPHATLNDDVLYPGFKKVVKHLRGGVRSFPVDFIVLRRFRRVDRAYAKGLGKINLKFSNILYTTAQLNLPADIAFTIPDPPAEVDDFAEQYAWKWRVRSQGSEYVGQWVEQRFELLFAPHSLLRNVESTTDFAW